ncbi:MAG: efflux RND transporter periplasmic adaptor subunit [Hyphomicrobiaceae bacterium]
MHRVLTLSLAIGLAFLPLGSAGAKDLAVTASQIAGLGIELAQVRKAQSETVALLPATVIPAARARIGIPTPFAGTLVQLHVLPGQTIEAGSPVATIASRELLEAEGQLSQAEAELQAAIAIAKRKRTLADKNIWSPSMAEEAEAQVDKVRAVVAQHRAAVSIGGIERLGHGRYSVRSPVNGKVAETMIRIGEPIATMAAAATVDTTQELWLEAQVPAVLARRIKVGDEVAIENGPRSKVISIGHTLDKLTRSVRLIAALPPNSEFLPGQMVTITVSRAAGTGMLDVPARSVAWIDGSHAVFARTEAGFAVKPVEVRGKSRASATVVGELAPGETVAASGLPQLEAILKAN